MMFIVFLVIGCTGNIGGLSSHEYHFPSATGEDRLKLCNVCDYGTNVEVCNDDKCPQCGSQMEEANGIEVSY